MKRFLIFAALFPPLGMLVFNAPDEVSKGIPSSEDLLAWLIASYPIAIVPALLMAGSAARHLARVILRLRSQGFLPTNISP
jgi:hypothetical protein